MEKTAAQETYYKYAMSRRQEEKRERRHMPGVAAVGALPLAGALGSGIYAGQVAPEGEGWTTGSTTGLGSLLGALLGSHVLGPPGYLAGGALGAYGGQELARGARD